MRFAREILWLALAVVALAGIAVLSAFRPQRQAGHITETHTAMTRMMDAMHATPSNDADRDFVVMMIPHHQGAIDMAVIQLRHGRNERLRRMAQGIVVEQQQEIAVMQAILDEELTPSALKIPVNAICRTRPQP